METSLQVYSQLNVSNVLVDSVWEERLAWRVGRRHKPRLAPPALFYCISRTSSGSSCTLYTPNTGCKQY